jgi:D-sedoheptulose 7-phosphate isomerase
VGYLAGLVSVLESMPIDDVEAVIGSLWTAFDEGRRVFIAGNGGSAATASHMACDLSKTTLGNDPDPRGKRFRVVALTDNVPLLTAWANDASYEVAFAEQLRNLAAPGDLLVVISCSGNSPNVVEAVRAAADLDMSSIALLGCEGGLVRRQVDHALVIPSDNYGYVEDAHMILNHLITAHFKKRLSRVPISTSS